MVVMELHFKMPLILIWRNKIQPWRILEASNKN